MFWLIGKLVAWLERPIDLSAELKRGESLKRWAEDREREKREKT
jgi:hypothetical protein